MNDIEKKMLGMVGATEEDTKPKEKELAYEEKIAELEKQNEMLTECLFELASIIYA